jgi:hypothetical protein
MGYAKAQVRLRAALATAGVRNGRGSIRHHQGAHGCDALPDEDAAEGRYRDGARVRLSGPLSGYTAPPHLVGLSFRQTD